MPGDKFRIEQGMDVVDKNGKPTGSLDGILAEDQTGMSRFITVSGRMIPVEAIRGVESNRVELTLPKDDLQRFPERRGEGAPSEEERRRAYQALGIDGPVVDKPPR